jgi:hypothetical protein
LRKAIFGVSLAAVLLMGVAIIVGAQAPPPAGPFGDRGPGMGGPMAGMFQFGGLVGGFGGKLVTGKPIQANLKIVRTENLSGGNMISNTTIGTYARGSDGSTSRDLKFAAIGPWAASGKVQEFTYIRNVAKGMQYIVNVPKGTYQAFAIRVHVPSQSEKKGRPNRPDSTNEVVTDNPNATYTDPVTNTSYTVDDRKVTRTIPAGEIGNTLPIVITNERLYSAALDLLLEETHTDPRFGTTTYQLSNIAQSPAASLFLPDTSFTQVQGGFGRHGQAGEGQPPPPPPQN